MTNQKIIFHITTKAWWNHWADVDYYQSPTFDQEGFIHLSTHNQVNGVLERYYSNQTNLLKLHIDASKLNAELKYESATNGELFPHLYGQLNKEAISHIEEIIA
jgi:uncharacterized protein (DUF952 family)